MKLDLSWNILDNQPGIWAQPCIHTSNCPNPIEVYDKNGQYLNEIAFYIAFSSYNIGGLEMECDTIPNIFVFGLNKPNAFCSFQNIGWEVQTKNLVYLLR